MYDISQSMRNGDHSLENIFLLISKSLYTTIYTFYIYLTRVIQVVFLCYNVTILRSIAQRLRAEVAQERHTGAIFRDLEAPPFASHYELRYRVNANPTAF